MIRAPQILLLTCLLFWGWQVGTLLLAVLMGFGLVALLLFLPKKTLTLRSYYQFGDLGVLAVLAIAAWYWLDDAVLRITYPTIQMLPLVLFPLLVAQSMSQKQKIPLATFYIWRRKSEGETQWMDVTWPFVLLCLFSAGALKADNQIYFVAVIAVMWVWLLLQRGQFYLQQLIAAGLMFVVVVSLAFGVHLLMLDMQQRLTDGMNAWLQGRYDQASQYSSMGEVGREKLSDDIVLRVKPATGALPPKLQSLKSYQHYTNNDWFVGSGSEVSIDNEQRLWLLQQGVEHVEQQRVRIFQQSQGGEADLALPSNALALDGLVATYLSVGAGGRVKALVKRPFLAYDVLYAGDGSLQAVPDKADLFVAKAEQEVIGQVATQLQLQRIYQNQGANAVVQTIHQYLYQNFTYLSWEDNPANKPGLNQSSAEKLSDFLWVSKAGHCEYFATAATLLLRAAGMPARYVLGYAVNEKDGEMYVVRGRDAHAWAIAYIDGKWNTLDATPPDWLALESVSQSWLQPINDWFSSLKFEYQQWRYNDDKIANWIWYTLLLLLFSLLAWRTLRRVEIEDEGKKGKDGQVKIISEWPQLEAELSARFAPRLPGELLQDWLCRIEQSELIPLAKMYCWLRFGGDRADNALDELNQRIGKVRQLIDLAPKK